MRLHVAICQQKDSYQAISSCAARLIGISYLLPATIGADWPIQRECSGRCVERDTADRVRAASAGGWRDCVCRSEVGADMTPEVRAAELVTTDVIGVALWLMGVI